MGWVKDGSTIVANYKGTQVQGVVTSSRVKLGGTVQYTVNLEKPVQFRWRTEPSTEVLISADSIISEVNTEVYSPFETVNS